MKFVVEGLHVSQGLLLGTLIGGAVGFAAVFYLQNRTDSTPETCEKKVKRLQPQASHSITKASDDEILSEQFTRNVQFFGPDGQQLIHGAFVVVVGLGVRTTLNLVTLRIQALTKY